MKTMKKIITLTIAMLLLTAFGTNISFAAKPTGGGKGGKVTVELATPNSVIQTNEEDVTIVGTGFDNGSSVRFLVTGTTDDSQIEVGPAQYISATELKVRIKTNGSTAVVDYDIEVQATSGRKGKGTTLFRVKAREEVCVDTEFPTFAHAMPSAGSSKGRGKSKEPDLTDIILTGNNGCTSYVLLSSYPGSVGDLKFKLKNGLGVISWIERTEMDESGVSINRIMGLFFNVLPGFIITPDQPQAQIFHEVLHGAEENIFLEYHDTTLDEQLNLHIAFAYIHPGTGGVRGVQVLDLSAGEPQLLLSGLYHFLDNQSNPYQAAGNIFWTADGGGLYINAFRADDQYFEPGVARLMKVNGEWLQPQLIVVNHDYGSNGLQFAGLSPSGILAYSYQIYDGKKWFFYTGLLNPEDCVNATCDVLEGAPPVGIERDGTPYRWTASGSLLFWRVTDLGEYSDAYYGIETGLVIDGSERGSLDSSF